MYLSVSIGTFLTNYDVTYRKLQFVQKQTKTERNTPLEASITKKIISHKRYVDQIARFGGWHVRMKPGLKDCYAQSKKIKLKFPKNLSVKGLHSSIATNANSNNIFK